MIILYLWMFTYVCIRISILIEWLLIFAFVFQFYFCLHEPCAKQIYRSWSECLAQGVAMINACMYNAIECYRIWSSLQTLCRLMVTLGYFYVFKRSLKRITILRIHVFPFLRISLVFEIRRPAPNLHEDKCGKMSYLTICWMVH